MTERLTAQQAAKALGYNLRHVYYLLRRDDMRGEKFGQTWIIPKSEVEEVLELRSRFGRFWADHRET